MNVNLKPILNRAAGLTGGAARQGVGLLRRVRHLGASPKPGMSDATLKAKVESTVFRSAGAPKSKVDVNVADGIVHLHGQLKTPAEIKALVAAVEAVPEVKGVRSDLHLPKTKAPSTPGARKRSSERPPKVSTTSRFNREVKTTGEPSPKDLAAARSGRQPAPLGAEEPAAPAATTPGEKVEETIERQSESPATAKTGTGAKDPGSAAS